MSDSEVKIPFLSLRKASILQSNRIVNPCAHSLVNWIFFSNDHSCISFFTQILEKSYILLCFAD